MMQQIQLMEQGTLYYQKPLILKDIFNSDVIISQQEQLINNIERELLMLRETASTDKVPPTPIPPQLPSQTIPRGYIINRELQYQPSMTPSPIDLSHVDDLLNSYRDDEPAFLKNIPIGVILQLVDAPTTEPIEDEDCSVAISYKYMLNS
jgi:hypothetical protein